MCTTNTSVAIVTTSDVKSMDTFDAEPRLLLVDAEPRPLLVDAEPRLLLVDAEPRPLLVDAEPRLSFSEEKKLSRVEQ